jgi:GNAT superfamily N-acetyltransferase
VTERVASRPTLCSSGTTSRAAGVIAFARARAPLPSGSVRAGGRDGHLTFRRADSGDIAEVVALVESAYRGTASREGWTTEADLLDGQRTDPEGVRTAIEQPESLVLLATATATATDGIVGCCHLLRDGPAGAYFGMFAVRPTLQAGGIGSAVLAEAERFARAEWGARSMRMTVIRQREDLLSWYERRGYVPTGETEPFPYGDARFGIPRRDDLEFLVLRKPLD